MWPLKVLEKSLNFWSEKMHEPWERENPAGEREFVAGSLFLFPFEHLPRTLIGSLRNHELEISMRPNQLSPHRNRGRII